MFWRNVPHASGCGRVALGALRPYQLFLPPLLAAMTAAVFFGKLLGLFFRSEELAPLAVAEGDLITALEYLERLCDGVHGVKADGVGLVELLEVSWIDKVAHGDSIHFKVQGFHRIGTFIGIDQTPVRTRRHEIDGWINQHFD